MSALTRQRCLIPPNDEIVHQGVEMGCHQTEKKLTPLTKKLYLNLMYCHGDAAYGNMPYVAYLLALACQEMQKLVEADERRFRMQSAWSAFRIAPPMK